MYEIKYGDVFSENCDLIVLPCNTLGGVTSMVRHQLEFNNIPYVQEAISPGKVQFIEAPKCKQAKVIGLAASINIAIAKSDITYIDSIYEDVKKYCKNNNKKLVNTSLLGTGLGGLSVLKVFDVLKKHFANDDDIYLRIFVISKSIYNTLMNGLCDDTKENIEKDLYEGRQYDQIFELLTKGKIYKYDYDVTLSFAGEDREYVEKIALNLKNRDAKVYYDKFEVANLWGKDLYQYLSHIYKDNARYCIIFVSQDYKNKAWTMLELKNAQNRAFHENREYILPIYLEDVELDGLNDTIGRLNASEYTYQEICDFIVEKINTI